MTKAIMEDMILKIRKLKRLISYWNGLGLWAWNRGQIGLARRHYAKAKKRREELKKIED